MPGAPLATAVRQRMPDVDVCQFQWSGANLHRARLEAAERLAERLHALRAEDVVIVAHSHGGNVARSASALAGNCSGLRVIVTVGTPFITIDQREDSLALSAFDQMADNGFGPFAAGAVAIGRRKPNLPKYLAGPYRGLAVCLIMSGAAAAAGALVSMPLRQLAPIDQLIRRVDPQEPRAEILIVATPGDEASLALAFGQFIGFLSWSSSRLIIAASDPAKLMALVGGLALYGGRRMWKNGATDSAERTLERLFQFGLTGPAALLALPMLLHWIDRLSTGWDGVGISSREIEEDHYTRVTVAATPRGTYTVKMLSLPTRRSAVSLSHSALLTDPDAVKQITGIAAEAFGASP
jgi:hypothetical protein